MKIHSHRIHPNQAYLNLIKIHRLSLLLDSTAAAAAAAAQGFDGPKGSEAGEGRAALESRVV